MNRISRAAQPCQALKLSPLNPYLSAALPREFAVWRANKIGLIVLLAGLALLGGLHYLLAPQHEQLADQVLALGFCVLLFGVALASWLSVKTPEPPEEGEGEDAPE